MTSVAHWYEFGVNATLASRTAMTVILKAVL